MILKKLVILASALAVCASAFAGDAVKTTESHFKFYGFVRTFFAFDTHEVSAGTEDLSCYMPEDEKIVDGKDLNAVPSFRFAALTSRIGVDVDGYQAGEYKIGGKIEADFYAGLKGSTGTAQLRLRQAYVTIGRNAHTWTIGQAWHPMAADLPDIFSMEQGSPFGPYSRTPQVNFEVNFDKSFSLTAAALWQMQYASAGPEGASANYIKYGCTPELYLGVNYKWDAGFARLGADMLSIKPRRYNELGTKTVNDRLTTFSVFQYLQVKYGNWTFKEKLTYANDGSHLNMIGGYGVSDIHLPDGSFEYTATRNLSAWITAQYKIRNSNWLPSIFLGYIRNFGTFNEVLFKDLFRCSNNAGSVARMYRIQPEILYNLGKLQFGLELNVTAAQYGTANSFMKVVDNLHWVANHRIQALVKYTF